MLYTVKVAFDADFQRHIEEYGLHFVLIIFGQLDPVLALLRGQVGGVHIIHGTFGDQARFEHGTEIGKNEVLKALLADVVEEQGANQIAR